MEKLPKIIEQRLRSQSSLHWDPRDPVIHPDADLLTAFAERSIAERERARVMEHLAHCGDCRDVVALALPSSEELRQGPVALPSRSQWFGWLDLRWGFAAAALLVATSIGIIQFKQARINKGGPQPAQVATNETAPISDISAARQQAGQVISRDTKAPAEGDAKNLAGAQEGASSEKSVQLPKAGFTRRQASDTVKAPDKAGFATAENRTSDLLAENQNRLSGALSTDVVKAKDPTPLVAAGSAPAFAPPGAPLQTAPALMMRASPRWNISSSGGLQRSFDAGNTWQDVNPAAAQAISFRAVSAVGSEVWAGGAGAALYYSSDSGTRWTQVMPSSGDNVLSGDVTAIQFSNPQHVVIRTSSGDEWSTADGGQSWQRQ